MESNKTPTSKEIIESVSVELLATQKELALLLMTQEDAVVVTTREHYKDLLETKIEQLQNRLDFHRFLRRRHSS